MKSEKSKKRALSRSIANGEAKRLCQNQTNTPEQGTSRSTINEVVINVK